MNKIVRIVHRVQTRSRGQLDLQVSSPKVRDYLVRMLNKLIIVEKDKAKGEGQGRLALAAPSK